jgi:putative endonuclease
LKRYWVYILECKDKSYYTGFTNDLDRRLSEHHEGSDSTCYTYRKRPLQLVFSTEMNDPNQGIALEKQIKGWTRAKKEALIAGNFEKLVALSNHNKRNHGSTSSP